MKKKALFLLAFFVLAGLVTNSYPLRPRGHGRGWYHGRRGHGRRGWRRPGWRRRGWWGPRIGVAWPVWSRRYDRRYQDYLDFAGHSWWEVTNNTPYPIEVENMSGGPRIKIERGETRHLEHPFSFSFSVQTPDGKGTFNTRDHFINIGIDDRGNLVINTRS